MPQWIFVLFILYSILRALSSPHTEVPIDIHDKKRRVSLAAMCSVLLRVMRRHCLNDAARRYIAPGIQLSEQQHGPASQEYRPLHAESSTYLSFESVRHVRTVSWVGRRSVRRWQQTRRLVPTASSETPDRNCKWMVCGACCIQTVRTLTCIRELILGFACDT